MSGIGSVSEGESWQVVLFFGREGEGEAGPVTGGESWDSSAQGGPGLFKGVF